MSLDLDFLSGVRLFFFFFFLLLFWSMMVMVGLVGNGEESEASLAAFAWPLKECGARGGGRGGASLDWSVAAPEGDRSGRKSSPPPPPGDGPGLSALVPEGPSVFLFFPSLAPASPRHPLPPSPASAAAATALPLLAVPPAADRTLPRSLLTATSVPPNLISWPQWPHPCEAQ